MKPARSGRVLLLAVLLAGTAAHAQDDRAPVRLQGTLLKVRDARAITLAYREASVPFSFLSPKREPIGYSIELCRKLVEAIGEAVGRDIAIRWLPVTSETRIETVASGRADLECGSTTNNVERQAKVAFSPILFVAGTKLLVRRGSPVHSYRDLGGRSVVVTAGTTNEKAMQEIARRFKLKFHLVTAPDHEDSYRLLASGKVDAFATDDVLLSGLVARHKSQKEFQVVGEFLSYDPYGIVFRRNDAQLAELVQRVFRDLAADGEIERQYKRWFLQKLPGSPTPGDSLDLPMSPQLETLIRTLVVKPE